MRRRCYTWTFVFGLALLTALTPALAQRVEGLPEELEGVGIDQRLDEALPLELQFTDHEGRRVRLGDYFDDGRPVLLVLAYYRCPMLCTLVLDGMVEALADVDLEPGEQFRMLTISIDPTESLQLARMKRQNYLEKYGQAGAGAGWSFLTGDEAAIRELTRAVGFRYRYIEETDDYAHPAALMLMTPDGRISRYLPGVRHDPQTLRLSLIEAAQGRIGSLADRFLLYCYQYDPESGRYGPVAMRLMRVAGGVTVLLLGVTLLTLRRREKRPAR